MSKKKSEINVKTVNVPNKGTLLENFLEYLKTNKKKSDIMSFLSATNAQYLGMTHAGLDDKKKKEVLDFAEYFMENFYDLMYEDMMENWGDDPFILRLACNIMVEEHEKERRKVIESASAHIRKEARFLADVLFAIRKYRWFTFNFQDGYIKYELPGTIPKNELRDAKEELLYCCTMMLESYGVAVVRTDCKDHQEVFGIRTSPKRCWEPVEAEVTKRASLVTPDGFELEPEDGVIYTEIQREDASGFKVVK